MADNETPSTSTLYERKLCESTGIQTRDELIAGTFSGFPISITQAGEYKRGLLMIEGSNNDFVPATAAGTKNKDCMILADDITLNAGETALTVGYYEGTFKADKVILAYETENDSQEALIDAIRNNLRTHRIILI